MWRDQQGNKKLALTTTWGDLHLGTTWPPLLSGWKSPGVGIPGVWVIFAENLKVINADKCSRRWHWHVNLVLSCFDGGQVPQRCLVSKVHVLNEMRWPFTASAHTRCSLFLAPISFLWRRRRHTFSCLFLNEDHELSRSHSRQIDLRRQSLHSCDLLPCWLRSKVAGVAYYWTNMRQLLLPKLVKVTLGGIFVQEFCYTSGNNGSIWVNFCSPSKTTKSGQISIGLPERASEKVQLLK